MPPLDVVSVWSPWRLHADALVAVLVDHGMRAEVVEDPTTVRGLLLADAVLPDHTRLLRDRRRDGRPTVVWGGTLPVPRVAALREAGASAYVSLLHPPRAVVAVVRDVLAGHEGDWGDGPGAMRALTPREREIAHAYLVEWADRTRAEVANRLGLSERTVKAHVANIRAKAGHRGTATRDGLLRTLTVRGWMD